MKVKKYTAPNMLEAMDQIRKELGKDAVILNSKEGKTRGFLGLFQKKYIEIIAAVDPYPIEKKRSQKKQQIMYLEPKQTKEQPSAEKVVKHSPKSFNVSDFGVNESSKVLPTSVINTIQFLKNQQINENVIEDLLPKLLEVYYSSKGTNENFEIKIKEQIKLHLLEKLKQHGNFTPEIKSSAKRVFLIGPTGVGKTTTIAKLAARASLNERKKVAFITLDTYRIAAIEQLKTYAKILNVPIEVAYNKEDYLKARETFSEYDVVFIDTAGRNYRKEEYVSQFTEMVNLDENDEIYSVLSLTTKEADISDVLQQFKEVPAHKVIFTKADETTQYGAIYNLLEKFPLQPTFITYGQNVPDDIKEVSPQLIADLIVGDQRW